MLNIVQIIGRVGQDPDIRTMQSGDKVANLSVATTEKWKDKNTGETKENTEWHKVSVFGGAAGVIEKYVTKGSKIYVEGKLQTRSWEQDGQKKYTTEIIVSGYSSRVLLLDSANAQATPQTSPQQSAIDPMEDDIPF